MMCEQIGTHRFTNLGKCFVCVQGKIENRGGECSKIMGGGNFKKYFKKQKFDFFTVPFPPCFSNYRIQGHYQIYYLTPKT